MNILVISSSQNPLSRSAVMAAKAYKFLLKQQQDCEMIKLLDYPMPLCDGGTSYGHPATIALAEKVSNADGIILASPVYNYSLSSAAKNLLELTGRHWTDKIVGFLMAAGGQASYMAAMPFANSLMIDYRCVIVPRFVYATSKAFVENSLVDEEIELRIEALTRDVSEFTRALSGLTDTPIIPE